MESPKSVEFYELKGEEYASKAEDSPYNAYYERPAMYKLIGDVAGLKVLDAGCGPGIYAEYLLAQGAREVVAVDASAEMVRLCRKRLGDRVALHHADISARMEFVAGGEFDLVICPLVLHYIRDWRPVFRDFFRALKPGGKLVFSTGHPVDEYSVSQSGNYFEVEQLMEYWSSYDIHVVNYRRPLSLIFSSFMEAGFVLEELVEPQPVAELEVKDAERYGLLMRKPHFICFGVGKPALLATIPPGN